MNAWNLIENPAPEELAWGYTPAPRFHDDGFTRHSTTQEREIRRYCVTLFAIFGLFACLQGLIADDPADGQRRLAQVSLTERKSECRDSSPVEPSECRSLFVHR